LDVDHRQDERGSFTELFRLDSYATMLGTDFVQDNLSLSRRWVIRGLHYQLAPSEQGKLLTVLAGSVFDVAVDLRPASPSFGTWIAYDLHEGGPQLWVPPGYAHGFLSLSDDTLVLYKVTAYHDPTRQAAIRWDDPAIGIEWPLDGHEPVLSQRDREAPLLADAEVPG
jgi:dTDP-4-dehydrorhamnose 3,5-epimerase